MKHAKVIKGGRFSRNGKDFILKPGDDVPEHLAEPSIRQGWGREVAAPMRATKPAKKPAKADE